MARPPDSAILEVMRRRVKNWVGRTPSPSHPTLLLPLPKPPTVECCQYNQHARRVLVGPAQSVRVLGVEVGAYSCHLEWPPRTQKSTPCTCRMPGNRLDSWHSCGQRKADDI